MKNFKLNPFNALFVLLICLGLGVSVYLAYSYSRPESFVCIVNETSAFGTCDAVRLSPYSNFLGIRVPYWGIAYFLGLLGLWLFRTKLQIPFFKHTAVLVYLFAGFIAELYFTYLLFFVLRAFCVWCFLIELSVFALFALYLFRYLKTYNTAETNLVDG